VVPLAPHETKRNIIRVRKGAIAPPTHLDWGKHLLRHLNVRVAKPRLVASSPLDASVAPRPVLRRPPDNERVGSRGEWWPTASAVWIGPASGDEVTVPAQQGCRLDEEAPEALAGEPSCQPGQYGPVGRLECRSVDLASEYGHFVAQHDDLDREVRVRATGEPDQLEGSADCPVQERRGPQPDTRRIRRVMSKPSPRCMDRVLGTHRTSRQRW
jgi:hypothetical protein